MFWKSMSHLLFIEGVALRTGSPSTPHSQAICARRSRSQNPVRQIRISSFCPPCAWRASFHRELPDYTDVQPWQMVGRAQRTAIKSRSKDFVVEEVLVDELVDVPCFASGNGDTIQVTLRVENLGGRRRRVSGGIDIDMAAERVWDVLTRYECNVQYMPNITKSVVQRLGSVILLEQVGVISNKLGLKSRILLRVDEDPKNRIIRFSRVEGRDFSYFEGMYHVNEAGPEKTRLDYELTAVPMPLFPVSLVERKIVKEVPSMLASVRQEAMQGNFVPL